MIPLPPLSLYVHVPWCVRKCPYCDFNSHGLDGGQPTPPFEAYVDRVLSDLNKAQGFIQNRPLVSLFFGGGTPSLMPGSSMQRLLEGLRALWPVAWPDALEITLEANPGTLDMRHLEAYREGGINRISLGVQSFNNAHLQQLGRIHDRTSALKAIEHIKQLDFPAWNIDLMFGLPQQSTEEALLDLQTALETGTRHVSWYQLTLEPNTRFYQKPPVLPEHDVVADMAEQGQDVLQHAGFTRYEVSAYTQGQPAQHNLNYWRFGDYLGLGAGAHSKISHSDGRIERFVQQRLPKAYLKPDTVWQEHRWVDESERVFEFMLNALRLEEPVDLTHFEQRTGVSGQVLVSTARTAPEWFIEANNHVALTPHGRLFLDNVTTLFLPQTGAS